VFHPYQKPPTHTGSKTKTTPFPPWYIERKQRPDLFFLLDRHVFLQHLLLCLNQLLMVGLKFRRLPTQLRQLQLHLEKIDKKGL
jgi:hypothetical protein